MSGLLKRIEVLRLACHISDPHVARLHDCRGVVPVCRDMGGRIYRLLLLREGGCMAPSLGPG